MSEGDGFIPEPQYVPAGEEFDDEDTSWRYIDDFTNMDFIKNVFAICGKRKYFASEKEARLWRKIDGQVTRGLIGQAWLDHCLAWAKKKNYRRTVIKVQALGNYIMNKAKMQDFLTSQPEDMKPKSTDEWRWE